MAAGHHARRIDGTINDCDVVHGGSNVMECLRPASVPAEESNTPVLDVPRRPSPFDHGFGKPVHKSLRVDGTPEAAMDEDDDRGSARSLSREPQITHIAAVWPVPDSRQFPHGNRTVVATAGSPRSLDAQSGCRSEVTDHPHFLRKPLGEPRLKTEASEP